MHLAPKHILLSALHLIYAEESDSEKSADFLEDIFHLAKIRIMKTKSFKALKSKLSDSHKNNIHSSVRTCIEDFLEKHKFTDLRLKLRENFAGLKPREIAKLSVLLLIHFENLSEDIKIKNDIISIAIGYIKNSSVYKRIRGDFANNSLKIEEYLETYSFLKLKNRFAEEVKSRDFAKKNRYDNQLKSIYGSD